MTFGRGGQLNVATPICHCYLTSSELQQELMQLMVRA